jgi:hypothetical protein
VKIKRQVVRYERWKNWESVSLAIKNFSPVHFPSKLAWGEAAASYWRTGFATIHGGHSLAASQGS